MPVSVTLSDSVVDDLALEDLGRFFLPPEVRSGEKGRKELKTWLETWLTADPAEIECRCSVILALSGMPDASWRRAWQPTPVFLPGESPSTKEPGGLQSMGSQRVRHN